MEERLYMAEHLCKLCVKQKKKTFVRTTRMHSLKVLYLAMRKHHNMKKAKSKKKKENVK